MSTKIVHWVGLTACVVLIVACFMPWAYYADAHIIAEADKTFTGFYSYQNNYGKPGKMLTLVAIVVIILMLLPKVWAKRTNLFVCALAVGYAIKSYILYVSCYNAYCPEKKTGIFLMLVSTIVMLIAAAFPKLTLEEANRNKGE